MPIDILMPALSPTMEEGTLAKWHVKPGDEVRSGDVIAEIETDKATMEVEAVDEGVVEEIVVPEGTEGVKVNAPIARLKGEGAATPPPKPEAPKPEPAKVEPEPAAAKSSPVQRSETGEGDHAPRGGGGEGRAPNSPDARQRLFASPLARRLAEQKGVDLSAMKGSGPHGRIVKADIDAAQPGAASGRPAATQSAAAAPAASTEAAKSLAQYGIPDGSYDLVPLDGMKKTIAKRMTDSFRDVPHFPLNLDIEIDELLKARGKINALLKGDGVRISVNDIVIKAAATALMRAPAANASYTPEGIAMHHHADVAMAVAIDGGLITPIIRQAETKGLAQITSEAKDLAQRARTRKLKPEEFQGGTFTVSNLGMFGITSFSSIINQPQGCILSVGAGIKRAVVKNDALAIATVMTVTLTCDHRVVDGATGARWLGVFKALLEDPLTMLV